MRNLGSRYQSWMRRRRAAGASTSTLLSRELPRKVARRSSDAVLQAMNRLCSPLREKTYAASVKQAFDACAADPCVVVVVPRILHYVVPCLELASRRVPVVIVLNGAWDWERQWLRQRFPQLPTVELHPVMGSMLAHGSVMKLLLRNAPRSFALLDPDLFVFEPEVFRDLAPGDGEVAVGAYGFTNRKTGLTFPTTHLLALDLPAVRNLMERHRVGPEIYTRTPAHLVEPLRAVGFGDDNYVKEYLSYYDPLNLIMALAVLEGLHFRVLDRDDREVFHVGGVSYLNRNEVIDYFNARLLELPFARSFAERYRRNPPGPSSIDSVVLERIQRTIERIAREVSSS